MQVFLTNLGCKLNQAEVDTLARQLCAAGHTLVGSVGEADLHVINSCTVTHLAARDSRKVARRARRENPGLRTVLTGCYATDSPHEARSLGVDLVVSNSEKEHLVELVHAAFPGAIPETSPIPVPFVPLAFGPTRAAVKVEDGCNMRCAFCIIPSTRGRQRSRPLSQVVAEVRGLYRAGYREVVITGVQISAYRDPSRGGAGRGPGAPGLADLVETLLRGSQVPRLRLTSIAPWDFDPRLLDLLRDPRVCRHVHLSLQSGCDETLRRMRRPYTTADYAALVGRIRRAVPGVAVTTDVIVGFPGETDGEFAASLDFVRGMELARIHAFPYSSRAGTEAASLPDPVSARVKKERMGALLEVAQAGEESFFKAHLGERTQVLWEEERQGVWRGVTDNYIRAFTRTATDLKGRLCEVRLASLGPGGVWATSPAV